MPTNNEKLIELIKENFDTSLNYLKGDLQEIKNNLKEMNEKIDAVQESLINTKHDVDNIKEQSKSKAGKKWAVVSAAISGLFGFIFAVIVNILFHK